MKFRKTAWIAMGVLAALLLYVWLRPTEAKRVRRVFAKITKEIRKDGPEGIVVATAKAHALADVVAAHAEIDIDGEVMRGAIGGRQLVQNIMLVRGQCDRIEVGFTDIAVEFEGNRTASVTADVYARGISEALDMSGRDARALEAVLEKDADDGKWRFTLVRLLPVVSK